MNIGIVGLGLIGGSIAKALRGTKYRVYARDITSEVVDSAMACGDIAGTLDNVGDIDILIIATYTAATLAAMRELVPRLKHGAIVTDVGGIKQPIMATMMELADKYKGIEYIGGHPMAGREVSGYCSAKNDIFHNATYLYTPLDGCSERAEMAIIELANALGCSRVIKTNAQDHDKAIAFSSQLPHVISNAYVQSDSRRFCPEYAGGSFRDFIRVAGLNSKMWSHLMVDNRENICGEIDSLINILKKYKSAIQTSDIEGLEALFDVGNACKKEIKE